MAENRHQFRKDIKLGSDVLKRIHALRRRIVKIVVENRDNDKDLGGRSLTETGKETWLNRRLVRKI